MVLCFLRSAAPLDAAERTPRRAAPQPGKAFVGPLLGDAPAPDAPLCLWYRQPAKLWHEALPVGNGLMGAMVFGDPLVERIQFNEHTVWTGQPHSYAHEGAVKALPEIRRLLQEGRRVERDALKLDPDLKTKDAQAAAKQAQKLQKEAEKLAMREFMSEPLRQKAYQPCGDLWLELTPPGEVKNYRRWLDLDSAVCCTEYTVGDATHRRETFASYPDRLVVVRVTANKPGRVACLVRLSSPHEKSAVKTAGDGRITVAGQVEDHGVRFESQAQVAAEGGKTLVGTDGVRVVGADAVTIRLAAATNFKNFRDLSADPSARCRETLARAAAKTYDALRRSHVADHQMLFRRVALDLGAAAARQPTDVRLAAFSRGGDPQLAALVFQYGRYLLIASSRPGGQPANLQGVWNDSLKPPWDSKYTCNINTQMNYWPALVANLAETQAPLNDALDDLRLSGRDTAKAHYGARGWVVHHNFDLWRGSAPINAANHGIWPTGGAWLCEHLWQQYAFTGDREFLARRAYPLMKEAAEFFVDYLVQDPLTGRLISGPSNSPEQGGLVMGPTMDHQIIRSLFANTAEAARILGRDAEFAQRLAALHKAIAPNRIGRHGQLQEWLEDKDDPNNKHRHVSHLWGVYPGADITWADRELFHAARQSLIYRGDAATGWSMGWKVCLWARFLDGDHAYLILNNLLQPVGTMKGQWQGGLYPNLFDACPPFQIDGNFGACAGVAEMLLQSHCRSGDRYELHLLPAAPKVWPKGQVKGLRARGGFIVDLSWSDGKLTAVVVQSLVGMPGRLRYGDRTIDLAGPIGGALEFNGELSRKK